MIFYAVILFMIVIDQISKQLIQTGMDINQSIPVIDGFFHITFVRNFGAAFSILQGKQIFLIIVTFVALSAIIIYLTVKRKEIHWLLALSLSLITGGGLGNLIDRVRLGYVVDFFDFRVFPVFNIADICVCIGCGLFILYLLYIEPKLNKMQGEPADDQNSY